MLSSAPSWSVWVTPRLVVTVWLCLMAWQDFERRELPHWGTTVPLTLLACHYTTTSLLIAFNLTARVWPLAAFGDGLAVAMAFTTIVLSDKWWLVVLPTVTALWFAFLTGGTVGQIIVITWLLTLALAKANIVGAGDAKLMMVLVGLFPDPRLAWLLLLLNGLVAGIFLIQRYGTRSVFIVQATLRDLTRLQLPTEQEVEATGQPIAIASALAGVIYVWLMY